jgi:hypothetical protein
MAGQTIAPRICGTWNATLPNAAKTLTASTTTGPRNSRTSLGTLASKPTQRGRVGRPSGRQAGVDPFLRQILAEIDAS